MVVPAHSLARWIHSTLEVREGVMRWEIPRTILGIVPLGRRIIEVPADSVASIGVGRAVRPISAVVGAAIMVVPFLFGWGWWAALTVPLGLWIVLVALGPQMAAVTRTGPTHRANVCFAHQIDADLYMAAVEDIARS